MMFKRRQSGVALIFTLGILTLLLVLGVGFVLNMTAENRTAANLETALGAEQAAAAGMERAVTELKNEMRPRAIATPAQLWYYLNSSNPSYRASGQSYSGTLGGGASSARYTLKISDAASKVHLNDKNSNLQAILEGLPGLDQDAGGETRAKRILEKRDQMPGQRFTNKRQIRLATGMEDEALYDAVKDFLVLDAYRDPSMSPEARSPVNINTAPKQVLSAVLRPVLTDKAEADSVADAIVAWRGGVGGYFDSWRKYDSFINGLTLPDLTADEKENLRDNANPNRLNTWDRADPGNPKRPKKSTEFCFHSGGIYEIESLGEALDRGGRVQAKAEFTAVLNLNKVLNVTRKQDFARSPEWYRVTWLDSCPVNSNDDLDAGYASNYQTINDSLKTGFWDNFDEDASYTQQMFKKVGGITAAGYALENVDSDSDKEFHHTNSNSADGEGNFGEYNISFSPAGQAVDSLEFRSSYTKVWNRDDPAHFTDPLAGEGDVGRLKFRSLSGSYSQAYGRNAGLKYIENDFAKTGLPGRFTQAQIYEVDPPGSDIWVGGTDPVDERFSDTYYLKEIDGSTFARPFHNGALPDATPAGGLGQDGHVPPHTKYRLKVPDGAVISDLRNTGPDAQSPPNFLYPYNYKNEKWYRLYVFHRSASDTQGVRIQISDSVGTFSFPTGLSDGELNTDNNVRGLTGFRNNANLAAWDNMRIICPFGDCKSEVLDGGLANGRWGSIAWTRTVPSSGDLAKEKITMDARSSASTAMTDSGGNPVTWTFNMPGAWTGTGLEPAYPVGTYTQEEGSDIASTTLINQRYVQFRSYVGSTRPDTDSKFCRETPVLEDVTITYFPRAKLSVMRRVGG